MGGSKNSTALSIVTYHQGAGVSTQSQQAFRYGLGPILDVVANGEKLQNPQISVREIIVRPKNPSTDPHKYWLVVDVNHMLDINLIGEVLVNVRPSAAINHETFLTVESGIRSGSIGAQNVDRRSRLDEERAVAADSVRHRLLEDWVALLENPEPSAQLLRMVAGDMQLARTELRKDAKDRVANRIGFRDIS